MIQLLLFQIITVPGWHQQLNWFYLDWPPSWVGDDHDLHMCDLRGPGTKQKYVFLLPSFQNNSKQTKGGFNKAQKLGKRPFILYAELLGLKSFLKVWNRA